MWTSAVLLVVVAVAVADPNTKVESDKAPEGAVIGAKAISVEKEILAALKKDKLPPPSRKGALVSSIVPGGPAEKAGLRKLDIIFKINSSAVSSKDDYLLAAKSLKAGQPNTFQLLRMSGKKPTVRWTAATVTITPITRVELARLIKETCPVEIVSASVERNAIGVPEVSVQLKNRAQSDVTAIEVSIECWNRFDEKVMDWAGRTYVFHGIGQSTIRRGTQETLSWQLVGHENTAKVRAIVTRVKLTSGTEWKADGNKSQPAEKAETSD